MCRPLLVVFDGNASLVEALLGLKSIRNELRRCIQTALPCAARLDRVDCLRLLWKAAQLEVDTCFDLHGGSLQRSTLRVACENGSTSCVQFLLQAGVSTEAEIYAKESPLQAASDAGHCECAKHLLEAGADVEATGSNFAKPLHLACQAGHARCVEVLLRAGASVHPSGFSNNAVEATPLVWLACDSGSARCVQLLIDAGASIDDISDGYSALDIASEDGHDACAKVLLEAGASTDCGY